MVSKPLNECNRDVTPPNPPRLEYNSACDEGWKHSVVYRAVFVLREYCQFWPKVTVRVVNLDGTPFTDKQVYVSGLSAQATTMHDEWLKLTKKPIRADLSLTTDGKGETTFDLPKPVPAYIYVRPVFSKRVWDCSCFVRIPTDELVQKGYITGSPYDPRKESKPVIQPEARELVFVMRRTPLWWQLLYPIEKG